MIKLCFACREERNNSNRYKKNGTFHGTSSLLLTSGSPLRRRGVCSFSISVPVRAMNGARASGVLSHELLTLSSATCHANSGLYINLPYHFDDT